MTHGQSQQSESSTSLWRAPRQWLSEMQLSREFWIFFASAFFFDAGFAVYFFLFNLYLLDLHCNDRIIGLIISAFTLGSVAGTLPAGLLAQRLGLRRMLLVCFTAAPLMGMLRVVPTSPSMQIALAFCAGVTMCIWGVCFLPALARLTTKENRAAGFALIFSASVGTATLGGALSGYLPSWLHRAGWQLGAAQSKRLILVASCLVALLGLLPVRRFQISVPAEPATAMPGMRFWTRLPRPVLLLIPIIALWSAVIAAFTPFAHVHLTRDLHVSLAQLGLVFSCAQILQLFAGLLTPVLFRALGLTTGIAVTQVAAALALACMAVAHTSALGIAAYLALTAAQWMGSPGLYNLLMSETPDPERSTAGAAALFCNALLSALATAASGALLGRFGYGPVLLGISATAVLIALLLLATRRVHIARPATAAAATAAALMCLLLCDGARAATELPRLPATSSSTAIAPRQDVPGNTLGSLEQAALLGRAVVEIDMRRTAGGVLGTNRDGFLAP